MTMEKAKRRGGKMTMVAVGVLVIAAIAIWWQWDDLAATFQNPQAESAMDPKMSAADRKAERETLVQRLKQGSYAKRDAASAATSSPTTTESTAP